MAPSTQQTSELDDLMSLFSNQEDRETFSRILANNDAASARVSSSNDLYRAFIDEDKAAKERVDAAAASRNQAPSRTVVVDRREPASPAAANPTAAPGIDPAKLDELVQAKVQALLADQFKAATFAETVQGIVDRRAGELTPQLLAQTAKTADEIAIIRNTSRTELGKELDSQAFANFMDERRKSGTQFKNYIEAFDAYAQEDRINKRIADGIAEGKRNQPAAQVPGQTLGSGNSFLDGMLKANKMASASENARGPAIDQAARALRNLAASRVE